jgi:excisionase family DNA binding protein
VSTAPFTIELTAKQVNELLEQARDPKLLTVPQAASELGIAPNTLFKMIAAGELRVVDMASPGSKRPKSRVRADDLQAFIESRTREPRAS